MKTSNRPPKRYIPSSTMLCRNSDQSDGDSGSEAEESETAGDVLTLVAEAQSKLPGPLHTYGSTPVAPLAPTPPAPAALLP